MTTQAHPPDRPGLWLPAVIILALGLAIAVAVAGLGLRRNAMQAAARFDSAVMLAMRTIQARLLDYQAVAAGVHNLFLAGDPPTQAQFDAAVGAYGVAQRYPEIRNISFIDLAEADGPQESGVAPHYRMRYVWPQASIADIVGLDVSAGQVGVPSLEQARTTHRTVASAPFASGPGDAANASEAFAIRYPVFLREEGSTPEVLRFVGVASVIVDAQRMLDRVMAASPELASLGLQIHDLESAGSASADSISLAQSAAPETDAFPVALPHHTTSQLPVYGRQWRLTFDAVRPVLSGAERALPLWEALAILLVTLPLSFAIPLSLRRRARDRQAVEEEKRLHEASESRFAAIFNQDATGVAVTDAATGRWLRVNHKYAELLGYDPDEFMRLDYRRVTHPDDIGLDDTNMEALRRGKLATFSMQKRMLRKDGRIVWVSVTVSPMWHPGDAPGTYITVVQDITSERLAQQRTRESEERLARILDHLPVALILVDEAGRITYRNERFLGLLGYDEAHVNTAESWWQLAYPAHERRWAQRRWLALRAKAREGSGLIDATEHTLRAADGSECPTRISGAVLDKNYLVMLEDQREVKASQARAQYLAYYDPLTRLPNANALQVQLAQCLAQSAQHGSWGALLRLDVDRFRTLNGTRGRDYGDELLTQIAGRLLFYTQHHVVARYGDDEFVVVLTDLGSSAPEAGQRASQEAATLGAMLNSAYRLTGSTYHASLSIGITRFLGDGVSAAELLKRTGIAVRQARENGGGTYAFFDPQAQRLLDARVELEADLREALEEAQLALHCQPQIEAGRIVGAEALLRWHHPLRGDVEPAAFVSVAEETGLILPLGDWVLRCACEWLAAWSKDPALAHLTLSVNVSARQFSQANFVKWVLGLIDEKRVPPGRLQLELTESVLLRDLAATIEKMQQLNRYGVDFSLDDFGTGYSSLAYLKELPIGELKIDQRFVRSAPTVATDAAIVRTIVTLGENLGMRVIAEGVETEDERRFLGESGCLRWQGFLLSPALAPGAFEAFIHRHARLGRTNAALGHASDAGTDVPAPFARGATG